MIDPVSMHIKVYTLEELESHIQFSHSNPAEVTPLSPLRLKSYLTNPRAEPKDPVLFELRIQERLVAYRTLLPDRFFDLDRSPHRFAWLSGNWVDPEFRRRGFSTKLLQYAEARWEGRLMYTNYAPESKAVYDRSGQFPLLAKRDGKRFYLRAAAEELLGKRLGSRHLLGAVDKMVNLLREGSLREFQPVNKEICNIERIARPDQEMKKLIVSFQKHSLFGREAESFNWILDNPWVTEEERPPLNYHFSYGSKRFENRLLKFTSPDHGTGLLWLLIHNRSLSAPYLFAENHRLYPLMARTLVHTMIETECAFSTLRHAPLAEHLMLHKARFLTTRNMPQRIFAHKMLVDHIPTSLEIQDGDGDVVFTG